MSSSHNFQNHQKWFPNDRSTRSYKKGEILFRQGDFADCMYVLLSGQVRIYSVNDKGREVTYNQLGPGEIFGELFLDGGPRSASVQAITPVECLVVKETTLQAIIHHHPDLAERLLLKLIGRLRRASRMIESLALVSVRERVVNLLEELGVPDGAVKRVPPIRQVEIAIRIASTREMVNIAIKKLGKEGYLHQDAKFRITILKPRTIPK